jgi:hypothetical protein
VASSNRDAEARLRYPFPALSGKMDGQLAAGTILRIPKQLLSLFFGAIGSLMGRAPRQAAPASKDERLTFFMAVPPQARALIADDLKRLIGWVAEAASNPDEPAAGQLVDAASTFSKVPGFTSPTDMSHLAASYRIAMPPLTGPGYYGLALTLMGEDGKPVALFLVNRLFRLPVILRAPMGVVTDIATVGALLIGIQTPAVKAAAKAAMSAHRLARELSVPLITAGQSLSGGLAQYQIAALVHAARAEKPVAGFVTFSAAYVAGSIERLGLKPRRIPGINFSKDRDPGVGPRSLLPNRTGLQIYIRPDGTGSLTPGPYSLFSALLHPWEHFLRSFERVKLGKILRELQLLERPDDESGNCR